MLKNRKFIAYTLVIVTTIVATLSFYFWQVASSANLNVKGEKSFVLYVPTGASYKNVVDSLHKYKMIHDEISFQFLSKWMKYPENVKPGRYEIKPNAGNKEILSKLKRGQQDDVRLTFNNIRLKSDLIKKIGSRFEFSSDELLKELQDAKVCGKYGFDTTTIMCMFLPNTYFIRWTTTPEKFLDRMHSEYKKYWTDEKLQKAKSINMTPVQVAIMASIVQSETNKKDEMPRVAGSYINRLAINMPLQADPTVKFAVGDFSLKRILEKHLAINSPYNTYRNTGLPPGPIALPEPVALDAVLNYERHKYIYFCAKEDFSGYHNFAENYNEHLNNARIYQEALNKANIK
ncbi:endolytic transglycosylase MltG [Emticicia sp. 17c]|uniref:endolytic transglycosylase MltG n=1 Tax=Emticicia sp. 17c TaxID=3127704 RepID=UPI00301BF27D